MLHFNGQAHHQMVVVLGTDQRCHPRRFPLSLGMTAIEFIKLQVADWLDDHPGKAMGRHHAWLVET